MRAPHIEMPDEAGARREGSGARFTVGILGTQED